MAFKTRSELGGSVTIIQMPKKMNHYVSDDLKLLLRNLTD